MSCSRRWRGGHADLRTGRTVGLLQLRLPLLGLIVEQATGRPLRDHLTQTFFAPLDLAITLDWPGPDTAPGPTGATRTAS